MGTQTATTAQLDNAQNTIIARSRFTAEHNAPCKNLVERFTLAKGAKEMIIPKVGAMSAQALTDGVDLVDSEAIAMSTRTLTTGEVGLKVILTDKLARQENEDVFAMVGRQMGDAMARKSDMDIIALFSALNGGTTLGKGALYFSMSHAVACVSFATAHKFPLPVFCVHHPNALASLAKSAMAVGTVGGGASSYYAGIMQGFSEELLRNFWGLRVNNVNFFHDGNIAKQTGETYGYGVIASKSAMCYIESQAPTVERERDASLRGTEVVIVSDYGCFEIDDGYGAPVLYEIGDLATTTT